MSNYAKKRRCQICHKEVWSKRKYMCPECKIILLARQKKNAEKRARKEEIEEILIDDCYHQIKGG